MAVTCNECGYDQNLEGAEFCDACGSELPTTATMPDPATEPTVIQPPKPVTPPAPSSTPDPRKTVAMTTPPDPDPVAPLPPTVGTVTPARLISKTAGAPIAEFILDGSSYVGIFDPDSGPVEIDLENFPGGDTVSRAHAEIYPEGGEWKVKELGSTNGIFIKPSDQTRYGARITAPQTLNPGDEVAFGKVRFLFEMP
ncbi:FHA domain-containing protein [Synechococcus moorigangaii CMS01]|nr:FHA domain-containing protein [Synechococcus moorigangaii CMS01]